MDGKWFSPEEMALIRSKLTTEHVALAEFIDDDEQWPEGAKISAPSKERGVPRKSVGRWPTATFRYREHVGQLLVQLAEVTPICAHETPPGDG